LSSRCSIGSPEHLVPGAAPVSSRRLQAPAADHRPVLNQTVEYGSNAQSAIIGGFQLSAIFGKPAPAKAAAPPNLHRRPSAHCFPARSFFGGFRTPASIPGRPLAPGRHPKPFTIAAVREIAMESRGSTRRRSSAIAVAARSRPRAARCDLRRPRLRSILPRNQPDRLQQRTSAA
jgi:hypothetical protein